MTAQQKQRNWFARHKVLTVILVIVGLMVIGGAMGGGDKTEPTKDTKQTTTEQPKQEIPAKWDVEAAYAKINNGMTKAQVEEATGKKSDNCTESQTEYIGKTELCTYGNAFTDKATITVTYMQDVVSSKSKSTF